MSKEQLINDLVNPITLPKYGYDSGFRDLEKKLNMLGDDWGGLNLCPDYQRGHVWTLQQRTSYIEAIMRGVISAASLIVTLNCPNWDNDIKGDLPSGITCVDGLQRISTIFMLLRGEIRPFGLSVDDFNDTQFSFRQGHRYFLRINVMDFKNKSDLLTYYLAINSGGTPHSKAEIVRIKKMLAQCTS